MLAKTLQKNDYLKLLNAGFTISIHQRTLYGGL